jgi:hypothetical protein
MTNGNRIGKFASLCLIGVGLAWIGCIAYRMAQDSLFPWQYRTVMVPIGCESAIVYAAPPSPNAPTCTPKEVQAK